MGPIGCPETSVSNNQSTLRDIPEERRSHLRRGGNLKPRLISAVINMQVNITEKTGGKVIYGGWNFNSGNYLFTTDTE